MHCVLVRDAKTIKNRTFVSCQVASRELHVPPSKIYISETSTNTVPNTITTAASFGTDANGMAVKVTSFKRGSPPDWFNFKLTIIMIINIFLSFRMPARLCGSDWSQSGTRTPKDHGRAGCDLIRKRIE